MKYRDMPCTVCEHKFQENEDVVVCPDCGTPHHRSCWNKTGECANVKLHGDFVWTSPESQLREHMENIAVENDKQQAQKEVHLFDMHERVDAIIRERLDNAQEIAGIKLADYIRFIGINSAYYLPIFHAFSTKKKTINLNIFAGFLWPMHQITRRMNLIGITLMVISLLLSIPGNFELMFPELVAAVTNSLNLPVDFIDIVSNISRIVEFTAFLGLSLFNDRIYFHFTVRKIKELRLKYTDDEVYFDKLKSVGNPSIKRMLATYVLVSLPILLIFYYLIVGFFPM